MTSRLNLHPALHSTSPVRRSLLRAGLGLGAGLTFGLPLGLPFGLSAHAAGAQSLTLYNGQHAKTTQLLIDAFTEATGITVNIRKGNSVQLANQIIEEGSRSPADVLYTEESPPVAALAERNLLARLPEGVVSQVRSGYAADDGTWVGITARCRVTVYNRNMVDAAELPASVLDMATEAWEGRLAFVPTSGAFQQQIIAIETLRGRDVALQWLKDLKKYGRIYNNNMAAMRAVERGEIATGLINNYYWYIVAREVGAENMNSALHFSGPGDPGALITVSAAGVLKTAPNADAAQRLVEFMVSPEGQGVLAKAVAEWPMNPAIQPGFDLKPFDELSPPRVNPASLGGAAEALELRREAGLA
ncbi:MAG: extracellular solute-binding protein [Castellaniella sp.]